jgi:hypothetical protein
MYIKIIFYLEYLFIVIKYYFKVNDQYWEEKRTLSELEFSKTKDGTLFIDCAYVNPWFFFGKNINFGYFFVKKKNFYFYIIHYTILVTEIITFSKMFSKNIKKSDVLNGFYR